MKTTASLLAIVAVAGLMMVSAPQQADARPKYLATLKKNYEKIADQAKDCGVCHGGPKGKEKKQLSDFAQELKKALGKANETDADKIGEALGKVCEKECQDGKTYGDLLNDGKLPPPYKEEK